MVTMRTLVTLPTVPAFLGWCPPITRWKITIWWSYSRVFTVSGAVLEHFHGSIPIVTACPQALFLGMTPRNKRHHPFNIIQPFFLDVSHINDMNHTHSSWMLSHVFFHISIVCADISGRHPLVHEFPVSFYGPGLGSRSSPKGASEMLSCWDVMWMSMPAEADCCGFLGLKCD